jgi:hypothetical protein
MAETDPNSVQFLYAACQAKHGSSAASFCLGYIEGASQVMVFNGSKGRDLGICPPQQTGLPSGAAMIQSFLNWASLHPEQWAEPTLVGVALSLNATWPCAKSN